jgi:hypothetical protein
VHFLRSTLCVGCAKGFEVVSLETTERQALLDQADTSLDFVTRKENVKPIHIERLNGEFLLNYSDFSFFVNRNGWRARPDWKIEWEGTPQAFALSYPYMLAFEPTFIEIRHVETSELIHVMTGKNVRMLHASTREVRPPLITCRMAPSKKKRADMIRFCTPTKMKLARMLLPAWISGVRVLSSEREQTLHTGNLLHDLRCVIGQRDDCSTRRDRLMLPKISPFKFRCVISLFAYVRTDTSDAS